MLLNSSEASEKLTGLAFGSPYKKVQLSTLFEHAKDDAICFDLTKCLLQVANHCAHETFIIKTTPHASKPNQPPSPNSCAHETFIKTKEGKTKEAQDRSSRGTTNSKLFISWDGEQHSYLVALEEWQKMTWAKSLLS